MTWWPRPFITIIFSSFLVTSYANQWNFNHRHHAIVNKISCVKCHGSKQKEAPKITKALCHQCHVDKNPPLSLWAPLSCQTCHSDKDNQKSATLKAIKPPSHSMPEFASKHGPMALAQKEQCMSCHQQKRQNSCTECHNKMNSIKKNPHPAHFLMTHGTEARLGVTSCTQCHRKKQCVECHRK